MSNRMRCRQVTGLMSGVVFILTICAGDSADQYPKTSGETLKAIFYACNDGRYADAETYFLQPSQIKGGIKHFCDTLLPRGTLKMVEILKESKWKWKEGIFVQAVVTLKNGEVIAPVVADFIKKEGHWKLYFPTK